MMAKKKGLRTPLIKVLTDRYHIGDITAVNILIMINNDWGEEFYTEDAFVRFLDKLDK